MTLRYRHFLTILTATAGTSLSALAAEPVDFNRDIRPILSNKCLACHGPDEAERKADLRLDIREGALADLDGRAALVPGDLDASELITRVLHADEEERMPPKGKGARLADKEIDLLRHWVAQGGQYAKHWSYEPPVRPDLPKIKRTDWPANPVDYFTLAQLEAHGLSPSPPADRWILARRAAIDLTGLPPTPEEASAFVNDKSPEAWEKYIDHLIAKPAFGERWARVWLDLARYADSAGYADDPLRTIWAYRDWVIRALNNNIPFNQFTIEQLAGDLLEDPTPDQLVATAFHRNTLTNSEGGTNDEEFRNVAIVDRVNTTMQTWMGTTIACAQCHTHKYDPISQNEFFQLFAFFNNTEDADRKNESPLTEVFTPEQREEKARLLAEAGELRAEMAIDRPELAQQQAKWEKDLAVPLIWHRFQPTVAKATGGTTLSIESNGLITSGGDLPDESIYTIDLPLTHEARALRLDALPVNKNVGRSDNLVISRISATHLPANASEGARGRYVRIDLPGAGKFLHLAEVEVFSGSENLARKGKASQISTGFDGPAHLAIDGNTDGNFQKKSTSHTADGNDPWWEVDLGAVQSIDRVVVWNRTDNGTPERIKGYRLSILDSERRTVWKKSPEGIPNPSSTLAASGARPVPLVAASASFAQEKFPATAVLTDKVDPAKGWALSPRLDKKQHLLLLPASPLPAGGTLRLQIHQESTWKKTSLAQFGFSSTSDAAATEFIKLPPEVRRALASPTRNDKENAAIAAHFRSVAPATAETQKRLAAIDQKIATLKPATTVPILRQLPEGKRRKTHVQMRGNYKDKGEEVSEGVPVALHPLPEGASRDRLTFAKWIMSRENPLTARVIANRQWEQLFGTGIVSTSEEFGSQGEYPSHPQLLDWLAVELGEGGWDLKAFLKLLVTSATYRQSSNLTPALGEADPFNRLLSRGPHLRLTAEMVRDQALFVSGLLSDKMYGPPTRPPRPKLGLRAAFGGSTDWADSKGEDRYRRGLYTEWRRSMPYPSMATFDAPNREVCTVKRLQTNTPLQALVTLNDPVYVEAAQAFARRVLKEMPSGSPEQISSRLLQTALVRPPRGGELAPLVTLYHQAREAFATDPAAATSMATDPIGKPEAGADLVDLAAWSTVANIVLNLDELLQKP